jgi:hypothetical protein
VSDPALLTRSGHTAVFRLELPFPNELHVSDHNVTYARYNSFEGTEAIKLFMTTNADIRLLHNHVCYNYEVSRSELDVLYHEAQMEAKARDEKLKRTGAQQVVLVETGTVTRVFPETSWQNLLPVGQRFSLMIDQLQVNTGVFGQLENLEFKSENQIWNIYTIANVVAIASGELNALGKQALKDVCHAFVPEFVLRAIKEGGWTT